MKKRKDKNGRVLPDGVSLRADGRYIYRYRLHSKQKYLYSNDLQDLKSKIEELKIDVASGTNIEIKNMCLNEWYPQYLKNFKEGKIKASSYMNKVSFYNSYVRDYDLGVTPMKDIKRVQIVKHFQWLADKKHLADGTLRALASMLRAALQEAVYSGGLPNNQCDNIMKYVVAKPRKEVEALTKEEVDNLIGFLKEDGFQKVYLPIVGILLGTGMRFGECDGLTWDDVDMDKRCIHVRKTLNYRVREVGGGHVYFITSPKTENAYRAIPMSEDVYRLFQMQREYQKNMRIRNDIKIEQYDNAGNVVAKYSKFIFTTKLGKPFTHEGLVCSLTRIIKKYNAREMEEASREGREPSLLPEKITPHMFRHTFCTRLVENKVSYESMKALMGHSSIKTSIDIYCSIAKSLTLQNQTKQDVEGLTSIF